MNEKLSLPVDGEYRVTLEYGQVKGYKLNAGYHKGIDIVSTNKRLILRNDADVQALPNNGNDGNAMYITFAYEGKAVRIAICHMANLAISSGKYRAGTYLGQMGMTGAADGVHAHIAVRIDGVLVNPRTVFNIEEEDMTIKDAAEVTLLWQLNGLRSPDAKEIKEALGRELKEYLAYFLKTEPVKANLAKVKYYDKDIESIKPDAEAWRKLVKDVKENT